MPAETSVCDVDMRSWPRVTEGTGMSAMVVLPSLRDWRICFTKGLTHLIEKEFKACLSRQVFTSFIRPGIAY